MKLRDSGSVSRSSTRLSKLCALLLVALVALGVRLYFDSKNKTPKTWLLQQLRPPSDDAEDLSDVPPEKRHKLQVEIVEADATSTSTPQTLTALQNVPYYGYLTLRTTGAFRSETDPYDTKGNFVDGPVARWKVEQLERFQDGVWKDVSLTQDSSAVSKYASHHADWSAISPANIGKWRMKVAVTAECYNDVGDVWQGSARRNINFEVTKDTIARKNMAQQVVFNRSVQGVPTLQSKVVAPVKAIVLKPEKSYLSHIEWAKTPPTIVHAGSNVIAKPPPLAWRKLPTPGDANYPLSIHEYSNIQLRVVQRPTEKAWPNYPEIYPLWSTRDDVHKTTLTSRGEIYRPSITLAFRPETEDKSQPKDYRFSVQCGNTLNATIRVWPRINEVPATSAQLQLDSSTFLRDQILVGGLNMTEYRANLTINLYGGPNTTPYRYRIRSTYVNDGSKAGVVEARSVNKDDDTITVNGDDDSSIHNAQNGRFSIRSGSRVGDVWVVAEQLDNDNKVIARTNGIKIGFVEPVIDNSTFSSNWTAKNGEWQRTVTFSAKTPNGRSLSGVPVRLRIKTLTDYPISAAASWLDNPTGRTDQYGRFTTTQHWKFAPGASLNLENYHVEGALNWPQKAQLSAKKRAVPATSSTRSVLKTAS